MLYSILQGTGAEGVCSQGDQMEKEDDHWYRDEPEDHEILNLGLILLPILIYIISHTI